MIFTTEELRNAWDEDPDGLVHHRLDNGYAVRLIPQDDDRLFRLIAGRAAYGTFRGPKLKTVCTLKQANAVAEWVSQLPPPPANPVAPPLTRFQLTMLGAQKAGYRAQADFLRRNR